jgi:phytoene dehydrogenase-like protein
MNGRNVIVIGGSVGGLVAAAYLARGCAHVTLLEARNTLGGEVENAPIADGFSAPLIAHTLYALDPRMVRELELHKHGLQFVERDMPLVALRPGGQHIVIARDAHAARARLTAYAAADADAYLRFRREAMTMARRLRPLWTGALPDGDAKPETAARALKLSSARSRELTALSRMSAASYLDRWFESDALKAALGFDAAADGLSPQEAGSALALLWRYAQESCGLQGAVAQPKGGPGALTEALAEAARAAGAELRTGARVRAITMEAGRPNGVVLESGENLPTSVVLSSLSARRTLELAPPEVLGLGEGAPSSAARTGTAKLLLALKSLPPFAGLDRDALRGRLVVAERPESAAEAKGAALAGRLPAELVMEITVPSVADTSLSPQGQHVLSVRVPYLPLLPEGGWQARREVLAERIIATLESYAPGLRERIVAQELLTPDDIATRYDTDAGAVVNATRMLTPCVTRARTPLPGIYLCGTSAEAVNAVSGCAGRVAANLVLTEERMAEA